MLLMGQTSHAKAKMMGQRSHVDLDVSWDRLLLFRDGDERFARPERARDKKLEDHVFVRAHADAPPKRSERWIGQVIQVMHVAGSVDAMKPVSKDVGSLLFAQTQQPRREIRHDREMIKLGVEEMRERALCRLLQPSRDFPPNSAVTLLLPRLHRKTQLGVGNKDARDIWKPRKFPLFASVGDENIFWPRISGPPGEHTLQISPPLVGKNYVEDAAHAENRAERAG